MLCQVYEDILSRKRRLEEFETVVLIEKCSAILLEKNSFKTQRSGELHYSFHYWNAIYLQALYNLGASVNLMS